MAGLLHVGTSGWNYRGWRGRFYPPGLPPARWLSFYAERFGTVEVNNTFYRLPAPETFSAWARQVPERFLFAVKGNRFITHLKKLKDPRESLERFFAAARRLGATLGPVLWQLPPFLHRDLPRLRDFIVALPPGVRHVFEFRHASWAVEEVRRTLEDAGMIFCVHDLRGQEWPDWVTGPAAYVRFHGPDRYGAGHIRRAANRIEKWLAADRDVYAYFNNDVDGHAVRNAEELLGYFTQVGQRSARTPGALA
jgi:uncharacterized protein YecE (DUF72 family)